MYSVVLRSAVPHDGFAVSIEDFFYWIIAGFLTFLMAFSVSEGVLRGYAAAAMALGALLYLETVSRVVQKLAARFFCFLYFLLRKARPAYGPGSAGSETFADSLRREEQKSICR